VGAGVAVGSREGGSEGEAEGLPPMGAVAEAARVAVPALRVREGRGGAEPLRVTEAEAETLPEGGAVADGRRVVTPDLEVVAVKVMFGVALEVRLIRGGAADGL
jgi:hypothetical protein